MTIREMARATGLSKSAVSLALRNSPDVSLSTRRRVQRMAQKVGYRPEPTLVKVMSAISRRRVSGLSAPIILLSDWPHEREWERPEHGLARFYRGMAEQAKASGHRLEEIWMRAPGMTPQRVEQILTARGIEGVIVFNYPSAPAVIDLDLKPYACVVLGRALVRPRLFAIDQDHHQGMFLCLEEIARRGYRRAGLLLDSLGHERDMHCSAAAYQFHSSQLPPESRIPIFITPGGDEAKFNAWVRQYQPDAIATTHEGMLGYIEKAGFRVPKDFGLAVLFTKNKRTDFAGIDIADEVLGARAVELVVAQMRVDHRGPPAQPETLLFDGFWRDGASLPSRLMPGATGQAAAGRTQRARAAARN